MRALCLAATLLAAARLSAAQDSAIAEAQADILLAQTMKPDAVKTLTGAPGQLRARVLIEQGSRRLPVPYLAFHAVVGGKPTLAASQEDGTVVLGCQGPEPVSAFADLTEADFSIRPLVARRLTVQGACGQALELDFRRGNPSAAALRVWRVATKAKVMLAGTIGPAAWPRGVVFHVNAGGATLGTDVGVGPDDTTFVVGHELGHAVSNAHQMIQMGFGDSFHTMTGCIGESAALEEGWASFFGAWVDQGPGASEPFEEWDHRQRIPLKALPEDVRVGSQGERAKICAGDDNEMRVTSFLWNVAAPGGPDGMRAVWNALEGKRLASIVGVVRGLKAQGADSARLAPLWQAAFQRPYPPSL